MGADCTCFGCYYEDLENDFTQGVDQYPKLHTDAHHMLANWKQDPCNLLWLTSCNDGIQFTNIVTDHETTNVEQVETIEPGTQPDEQSTTCTTHGEPGGCTGGRGFYQGSG